MNHKQRNVLIAGGIIAVLTLIYPPFILTGGIIPDFQYSFIWSPPAGSTDGQDYQIFVFWPFVLFQLALVMCATAIVFRTQREKPVAGYQHLSFEEASEETVWPPPPNKNA